MDTAETVTLLLSHMREEADDAKGYALLAHSWKVTDKAIADMFMTLSKGEVEHFTRLQEQAARILAEAKTKGEENISGVILMYNAIASEVYEDIAKAKVLQDSIK